MQYSASPGNAAVQKIRLEVCTKYDKIMFYRNAKVGVMLRRVIARFGHAILTLAKQPVIGRGGRGGRIKHIYSVDILAMIY